MGDVALTAPVIHSVLESHSNLEITFLSRGFFEPLFNKSNQFKFKSADLKSKHKGVLGLRKLFKELKQEKFDAVIDLHDVLRTKILRSFFKLSGTPVFTIDKGRSEKNNVVSKKKPLEELKHMQQRYLDVFGKAGIESKLKKDAFLSVKVDHKVFTFCQTLTEEKTIGIAPFAAHWTKEIGTDKLAKLVYYLTTERKFNILLFGGGEKEKQVLESFSKNYKNTQSIIGQFSFEQELMLMHKLDAMIAMDSGNMHLASLVNTKVVSIWTATHPYLGFSPYQNKKHYVQVSTTDLPCRPCTVYGKVKTKEQEECAKKAIKNITVEMIIEQVDLILK